MKISIAQINTNVGDFAGNAQKIINALAASSKADILVTPELALCGYPPRDLLNATDFVKKQLQGFDALVKKIKGNTALVLGYVAANTEGYGKAYYNAAAFIYRGKVLHVHHKNLLPNYDVFDESRYFEPGQPARVFTFKQKTIGLSICEDLWSDVHEFGNQLYGHDPLKLQVAQGAELLINLSASPYYYTRPRARYYAIASKAHELKCPIVYANAVGAQDDIIFDGHSLAFNAKGQCIKHMIGFESAIDLVDLERAIPHKHDLQSGNIENEQILDALILGLRDYLNKSGIKQVVLGLSGGLDSSLVAWIACEAIGSENVLGVAMPSAFSSIHSLRDARELAENLKMSFKVVHIGDLYAAYKNVLKIEDGKKISLTLQNLQARIRGNILMAISNEEGRMVLVTGNKSELAMGYCTLYGDMAGGLAVIGDLFKTKAYELARLANKRRMAINKSIMSKAPSAELAPGQKDQDDLPPYEVLDEILSELIEARASNKKLSPKVRAAVKKRLESNEFKRFQAPPVLRISNKAFGSGRRIPIVKM